MKRQTQQLCTSRRRPCFCLFTKDLQAFEFYRGIELTQLNLISSQLSSGPWVREGVALLVPLIHTHHARFVFPRFVFPFCSGRGHAATWRRPTRTQRDFFFLPPASRICASERTGASEVEYVACGL